MRPPSPTAPPDAAQARAERHERLLASLEEGLWERNLLTGDSWYSPRYKRMLGFASNELPDDPSVMRLRVHPEDLPVVDTAMTQAARDGTGRSFELRMLARDGHWRWFRERVRVWPDDHGRPTHLVGNLVDIDAEMRALAELARMTARFERAIAASDEGLFEGVWGVDDVQLSARACELVGLGHEPATFSHDRLRERLHPEDVERVRAEVAAAALALGRWQVVYRARRFDPPERHVWLRERGTATREANGDIRISGMLADVNDQITSTERLEARVARRTAELAEALKQADAQRAAAESANRAKASFLGQMSHELRTPLNGVLGMIQLALRVATSDDQVRYLDLAAQAGDTLLRLVDDVLDFARAEAGKLTLRHEPFDLEALLAETFRGFLPLVRPKPLHMMFDYAGDVRGFLGDAGRLRQIVSNLVGNAVKFTDEGSVQLVARSEPGSAPGTRLVTIEVRDTGPGMDAGTSVRVFEPFEQGDRSITRQHGGTGLGLPIVRMLASLMGGAVDVDTAPGAGATFRVVLPLPVDPDAAPAPAGVAPGHAWLIYRHAAPSAWLSQRLARVGWTSTTIESVAVALQRLESSPREAWPRAVIVQEMALTPSDDLEGLRQRLPAEVPITLLLRPDYRAPDVLERAQRCGIGLSFAPLTHAQMLDALRASPVPASPVPPAPAAPSPGASRRVLVVEDNALNRLIAHEMLVAIGVDAQLAESGEEALQACTNSPPDLVLMDIQMPGMDGLETARRLCALQSEGRLPPFPIVALTAHAMPGDREASLQVGMSEHLTKPIQFRELQQVVLRYLPAEA